MGSVAQAVLEFDEEVQAPWRPRLVVVHGSVGEAVTARAPVARPARRSPSRVGVCRPPATPGAPARRYTAPRPVVRAPGSSRDARCRPLRRQDASGRRPGGVGPAAAGLRLTRRARRLAVVLALAAGVAVGSWVGPLLDGGAGGLRLAAESTVVVQLGDTLWSIASSLDGHGDVRALIDQIQALNDLRGAELVPGQTLLLP